METNKQKLTDNQLRAIQIVLGIVAAVALFLSIILPTKLVSDENSLLNYIFVVVFLVVMMGRRSIENKYRLRLNLFSLALMDGILASVIVFTILGLYSSSNDMLTKLDNTVKILIIAGLCALLLGLGILLPLIRYFKRKANGTLPPIRIPEKPEPSEDEPLAEDPNRPMTVEEKIAAMSRELEQNNTADDIGTIQGVEEETEDKPKE